MKKVLLFMLAAGAVGLTSCQKEKEVEVFTPGLITIEPLITRATEVNFEDGDRIGLTVTKEDASSHATNQPLTYGGGVFTCDLAWYSEAYAESHLLAYYPYNPAGAPTAFTVAADQTATGYGESDLMGASKTGVRPSANAVSMTFKHLLTNVVINMENESGSDIVSVTLSGAKPTANVDLENLSVEVDDAASAVDIIAQEVVAGEQYRLIVVPQTVAFTLTVATSGGATLSQSLLAADLVQGKQYTADVRVMADGLLVSISGDIENWGEGGDLRPEGGGSGDVEFEEFTGYFVYDGETYQTVTLANNSTWMAEPLRYIPAGYTPSADPTVESHIWYPYTSDGTNTTPLTDAASITALGYLYDSYVAFGGVEVTAENCDSFEGAQGICPTGWHIPTRADYYALCGNSNKAASGETGQQTNASALFYDSGYTAGKIGLFNTGGFNYVMTGVRMQTNFAATPSYQKTVTSASTCSVGEWIGKLAVSYYMTSTVYAPLYLNADDPELLTNIQFFTLMSTFTGVYKEGKLSLAYASTKAGQSIRCVKD